MALTKQEQGIITTGEAVIARTTQFLEQAKLSTTEFNDSALRLALELIKYGEYIKTVLILHNAAVATAPAVASKRKLTPQELAQLQGATEEEKELVERTPPPGFNA